MLTVIAEYIIWFKTHYNILFNLLKFGGALFTAYTVVLAFKRQRFMQLSAVLDGIRAELASLERLGALYRHITRRNQRLQAHLDSINAGLTNRTPHAVLERAISDRAEGNYEPAAHLLATWFDAERQHTAKAACHLARCYEQRAEERGGNAEALEEAERLKRIAALMAPQNASNGNDISGGEQ